MGSDQWCYDTMGAKQSKQNRSDNINQSQDISEFGNNGNTSTLPASFRRKGKVVSQTGSLPRNAGSQKFERSTGAGGSSIGKKIRKSCRNWAVQKGLVQKSSKSANAEPAGETKPVNHANEDNEKAEVVDDTNNEPVKEDTNKNELDVGALVAALVVEAHKKKRASRALSKEALLDADVKETLNDVTKEGTIVINDSKERGTEPDEGDATKADVNIHNEEESKHETNIESLEQTEIIVKTNEDEKIEKVNNLQSRENLDDGVEIENDNEAGLPTNEVETIEIAMEEVHETDIVQNCNESTVDTEHTSTQNPGQISNNEYETETEHIDNNAVSITSESNNDDDDDTLSNENITAIVEDIVEASMQQDDFKTPSGDFDMCDDIETLKNSSKKDGADELHERVVIDKRER